MHQILPMRIQHPWVPVENSVPQPVEDLPVVECDRDVKSPTKVEIVLLTKPNDLKIATSDSKLRKRNQVVVLVLQIGTADQKKAEAVHRPKKCRHLDQRRVRVQKRRWRESSGSDSRFEIEKWQ
jgi:hypothetical protein